MRHVRFQSTPKMSSYLLHLSVGDLERVSRTIEGVDVGIVMRRGAGAMARFALDATAESQEVQTAAATRRRCCSGSCSKIMTRTSAGSAARRATGGRRHYISTTDKAIAPSHRDKRRDNFTPDEMRLLDMLQPAFVTALARAQRSSQPATLTLNTLSQRLTTREQDTARLVMLGMTDKEIARALHISTTTVRTHLENAFRKVGVSNRAALVHKLRP
jgi:DNA-binding NarL/FixJ family response regulator